MHVIVLADGVRVAAGIAARLRPDLVREGACDGYHGFVLPLPASISPTATIEARERGTEHVFGRILSTVEVEAEAWRVRIDESHEQAVALNAQLDSSWGDLRWSALSAALSAVGARLAAAPGLPNPQPRLADGLSLATVADPVISLILDSQPDGERILASVMAIAPLLASYRAELVITDDGRTAGSPRLTTLPGLRYCFTDLPPGAARANHAAQMARGGLLAFLRAGEVSTRSLALLLDHGLERRCLLLGAAPMAAGRQAGLGDLIPAVPGSSLRTGLSLLTSRDIFVTMGALDPDMEDGAELPALDFAMRARAAGHAVMAWRDHTAAPPPPAPGAAVARGKFVSRWSMAPVR